MTDENSRLARALVRSSFYAFVKEAFRHQHEKKLGKQPYIEYMCSEISRLIKGNINRLLINLPPQHLKSFVGTVCLAAYLLGKDPRIRILLLAYGDSFAKELCDQIRDVMRSDYYQRSFATRLRDDHSRTGDFKTTKGGGVFATSTTGAITGRSADFIIYDDPHQITDWNDNEKLNLVWTNFSTVLSRLNDKVQGRIVVVAHRVSDHDFSSHLLTETGWEYIRLPLIAIDTETYDLEHGKWVRERESLLRPKAFSPEYIAFLQRQPGAPFDLLQQQGLGVRSSLGAQPDDFQNFNQMTFLNCPVVLSIDPGIDDGADASRSVVQAWKCQHNNFYLIDLFCEPCDAEGLRTAFWKFVRRHNPSVALIEKTANGPALHAAVRRKAKFKLELITPRHDKATRLRDHLPKIRAKRIYLPEDAIWRDAFINEVVAFPGEFDDQVDAMTQYLDFMDNWPTIPPAPVRALGVVVHGRSLAFKRRF